MRILLNVKDYDLKNKDALAKALFSVINGEYMESVPADSDYYLLDPEELSDDPVSAMDLILGAENPDKIISETKNWNERIDRTFDACLKRIMSKDIETYADGTKKWHEASIDAFSLKNAAIAVDGGFYAMAEYMTYIGEFPYLKSLLNKSEREEIIASPHDYALISVYPK